MTIVKFSKPFKFSPNGIDVVPYEKGQIAEVDDECALIAIEAEYAEEATKQELAAFKKAQKA